MSSSLLLRVQAQEPTAWQRLVQLYSPLVYSWCRLAGLQEADALDIGQEVFQTLWMRIQSFRRDRPGHSFRAWLRTMTQHKMIDAYRRKQGERAVTGGADNLLVTLPFPAPALPEPDDEQDDAEANLLCHRAIALIRSEFEEKTWRVFEAVVMHGQKPTDVAAALNIRVNVVYLAKSRILRRLREEFAELLEM